MASNASQLRIEGDILTISSPRGAFIINLANLRYFGVEPSFSAEEPTNEIPRLDTLGVVFRLEDGMERRERFNVFVGDPSVATVLDELGRRRPEIDLRRLSPKDAFATMGWWTREQKLLLLAGAGAVVILGVMLFG